jgi:hypothetical protein
VEDRREFGLGRRMGGTPILLVFAGISGNVFVIGVQAHDSEIAFSFSTGCEQQWRVVRGGEGWGEMLGHVAVGDGGWGGVGQVGDAGARGGVELGDAGARGGVELGDAGARGGVELGGAVHRCWECHSSQILSPPSFYIPTFQSHCHISPTRSKEPLCFEKRLQFRQRGPDAASQMARHKKFASLIQILLLGVRKSWEAGLEVGGVVDGWREEVGEGRWMEVGEGRWMEVGEGRWMEVGDGGWMEVGEGRWRWEMEGGWRWEMEGG